MTNIFKNPSSQTAGLIPSGGADKLDFQGPPNACLEMVSWSSRGWTPPEAFGSFPILDICPDAPAYFAKAGHFTNRDLRAVATLMNLDVDFRDPESIYRAILTRSQNTPWILPYLEIHLRDNRSDKTGQHGRKRQHKDDKVIGKMPLSKLRLLSQPDLHDRVDELCNSQSPVPVEVGVAAFCEYAIHAFLEHGEGQSFEGSLHDAVAFFSSDDPDQQVSAVLGDLAEVESWIKHAGRVIHLASDTRGIASEAMYEHATRTLKELSLAVTTGSDPSLFELIMCLAAIAREQAEILNGPRREVVLDEIAKTGIDIDPSAMGEGVLAVMEQLLDRGLFDILRSRETEIVELRKASEDLKEQIGKAYSEDDFALLGQIAPMANEAKQAALEACNRRDHLLHLLKSLALETSKDSHVILEHLDLIFDEAGLGDQAEDPGATDDLSSVPDADRTPVDAEDDGGADALEPDEARDDTPDDARSSPDAIGAMGEDDPGTTLAAEDDTAAQEGIDTGGEPVPGQDQDNVERPVEADLSDDDTSMDPSNPAADDDTGGRSPETALQDDAETAAEADHALEPGTPGDPDPVDHAETPGPAVPVEMLADLVERDLVGIAADAAEIFEAREEGWPLKASALRAAAASRAPHREFGPDTQKFLSVASRAIGDQPGDLSSVLLLGALIRPSIFEKSSGFRDSLSDLCRGNLGKHLQQATEAISGLDYDFPPDTDELARLSGAQRLPQKQRLAAQLGEWCDKFSRKTSRWPFATAFMHHVVSDNGPIGGARVAIDAGSPDAVNLARKALSDLSSHSEIEDRSIEFGASINRTESKLHPKGVDYLSRQFDEPLGILDAWVRAVEREKSQGRTTQARLQTTIGNLQSRLEKAIQGLRQEYEESDGPLTRAVAQWIILRIDETLKVLKGQDASLFATLEEALTAERDLLPAAARDRLDQSGTRHAAFRDAILTGGILEPAEALARAREEGAFDTASRLAERFDIEAEEGIRRDMEAFAKTWHPEVEHRARRLKTLSKLDYKHQDEISRWINYCDIANAHLEATSNGSEIHDLADLPGHIEELDHTCILIETNIRADQAERIDQYRNEQNEDEADALLSTLETLNIESIEDRIAQLRDGRSAATFQTELQGVIADFNPAFLTFATSKDWPFSAAAMREAVASEGPLFIEDDRRAAGLDFIEVYRAISKSAIQRKPNTAKIREFLEAIGFERVKIHDLKPLGRSSAWSGEISGEIRSVSSDDWFLPPVFGSQAAAGYQLLLVGPDVLPEVVTKALSTDMPAILIMCGVADLARRQELAERLRANAIPALVIDEALTAFTATRRQTRARTIFECGLPYGRVDPYTTDAGALPPEMFFGREEEIRHIMSKKGDGCLVYGGRQLGKSALLGHVSRTRHAPENDMIVVRRDVKSLGNSEKASEIWTHLAGMLSPEVVAPGSRTAEAVSRDIRNWIARKARGRIVCMFDEADYFMDADTRDDYPELSRLKELMEVTGRAFKVVFAGLHNVQRMHRQPNSPLAHLGEPICIGPLNRTEADKRAAHDLVVNPMRAAGFHFESNEAVEEILAWANYYPSLVQEYMKGLLATLHGAGSGKAYKLSSEGPLWPISSDTLFTHRGFGHIENRIREKFHLTLNLDPRYALVAYTLGRLNVEGSEHEARVTGFRTEDLLKEARTFWPKNSEIPSLVGFEAILEELFDLGVLGRVPIPQTNRFRYLLGSRQVAAMLGSEDDIYHALSEIEEKDPAVAYDRTIHRRRYGSAGPSQGDSAYAPLTDLQIERIVDPHASPVQIVCGLDILGLSKVGTSLKKIAEMGRLPGARSDDVPVHIVTSERDLRNRVERSRPDDGHLSLVVYTPASAKSAQAAINWLERQARVLGGRARPLIILDAADADMRGIANARHEQSQYLAAWGAEMVRVHLHHIEKTDLDTPQHRDAILGATGGIPSETVKLIREMRTASDPMKVAKSWTSSFKIPAGILNDTIGQALVILDMFDGEDYEAFNDLMREDLGFDLVDVGPDLLASGLVATWDPEHGHIRRSALGNLVAKRVEE